MENKILIEKGDWVKLKNGTQGMTVISHDQDGDEANEDLIICQFRDSEGRNVQQSYPAKDLIKLRER